MAISHADHDHKNTPAARAACRRRMIIAEPVVKATTHQTTENVSGDREIRMTGPVARRMARQAMKAENARIQPRRSGARVSARNTSCVQAALHIDAHGGRCACGWEAVKVA